MKEDKKTSKKMKDVKKAVVATKLANKYKAVPVEELISDHVAAAELKDLETESDADELKAFTLAVARVAHEVNRAYCEAIGDDLAQYSWENAPKWMQESIVNGVELHLDNPDVTLQESHNNWVTQKEKDGWKYGPVKDEAKKQHPCFIPYAKLPTEQKAKDYIFRAIVRALSE